MRPDLLQVARWAVTWAGAIALTVAALWWAATHTRTGHELADALGFCNDHPD